jgi:hypothetical protein
MLCLDKQLPLCVVCSLSQNAFFSILFSRAVYARLMRALDPEVVFLSIQVAEKLLFLQCAGFRVKGTGFSPYIIAFK